MLPGIVEKLATNLRKLELSLPRKLTQQAGNALAKCEATLLSVSPYLDRDQQFRVNELAAKIRRIGSANGPAILTQCGPIIAELHGLVELLKHYEAELPWRPKDG